MKMFGFVKCREQFANQKGHFSGAEFLCELLITALVGFKDKNPQRDNNWPKWCEETQNIRNSMTISSE